MKKNQLIHLLGIFCFAYWALDVANMIFFVHKPEFMLWYSSAGLLFTSIALLTKNAAFISTMFCALFLMEGVWSLDFLGKIFFNNNFLGITNYLFEPTFSKRDFFMSMYHLLLPPVLLVALFQTKKVFRYSWVGSTIYASTLVFLTFLIVGQGETVNCVHQLSRCRGFFSFIFTLGPPPYHILIVLLSLILVVFLPTNYFLLKMGERFKWRRI